MRVTLSQFFKEHPQKSTQLFREFIWILESKFQMNPAELLSGVAVLSEKHQEILNEWAIKKEDDYPLQYFLGQVEFFDLNFYVEPGALIPRLETEEIARWSVDYIRKNNLEIKNILDIGSGTGCLGLSVLKALGETVNSLTVVEPYEEARKSLEKNIITYGGRKTLVEKNPFEKVAFDKKFDLIVSNPPYIAEGDAEVQNGVYKHEPHEALFAGNAPIALISEWVEKSFELLNQNALLVFEIGYSQKKALEEKLKKFDPKFLKDSFGKDRFFYILK